MPADTQSVLPRIAGVPWWGAVLIAAVFTSVGATIDVLVNSSLGPTYNSFFLVGCILAVLAVRRRALFTAAVQPPLITVSIGMISLYAMVLSTKDSSAPQGMRKAVLKVALPFSNMFPWILGTFVLCVLIAVVRWLVTRSIAVADRPQHTSPRSGERGKAKPARPAPAAGDSKKTARDQKTAAQDRRGRGAPGKTKPGKIQSGKRKPGTPGAGQSDSAQPQPARKKTAPKKAAPKKAGATSAGRPAPRPQSADQGQRPAQKPAPAKSAPAKSASQKPAPRQAMPSQAAPRPPAAPGTEGPSTGTARPVRRSPSIVGQGDRPVRRAEPQVIPPRPDTAARPRRTAAQQLREQQGTDDVPVNRRD